MTHLSFKASTAETASVQVLRASIGLLPLLGSLPERVRILSRAAAGHPPLETGLGRTAGGGRREG